MAGDVNVELGNTDPPDPEKHRKAALALADRADKAGMDHTELWDLLEMIGFIGWEGSGAPVESPRVPEPPKVRDRTGGLRAAQSLSEAAPIDGHPGECSDRSASRPEAVSDGSRDMCGNELHEMTEQNTYRRPDGKRECRQCIRDRKARKKAAA